MFFEEKFIKKSLLATLPKTGKSIVHSVKMKVWKKILELKKKVYIKIEYFKPHIPSQW